MRPRQVVPGRSYMITRRCTQRQFLLRPDKLVNQAVLYCLAEAAVRFDVTVMWVVAMSNHVHYGLHDPHGVYPEFMAHFHKMVAKVVNCHHGRFENLWSSEQANVVELIEPHDAFSKMIYSLANVLVQHLVQRAHHWPGVSSLVAQLQNKTLVVRRPHWFFDKNGTMPEQVELTFGRPAGFEHLAHDAWAAKIREAIAAEEAKAANERAQTGIKILGRRGVLAQSWKHDPRTREKRRGITPRVAAKTKWSRIAALQRNEQFQQRYREAFEARRRGDPDVAFPYGTYKLRVLGLVRVEPPPV